MLGIYTRLSIDDDESNSLDNQKREGIAYGRKNDLDNSQIFIYEEEKGVKGSAPIEERPALLSMVNDIKSGKITMVWTRKQSRISRKLKIFNDIIEEMIDYKITLYMGDRGLLDLQSPLTKMMLQIMAAFDEYAPNSQSYETKKSLYDNFKEGKAWGIIPYGYETDENMIPYANKQEANIINRIFEEYLSGKSTYKIAEGLNEDEIPTKYNKINGFNRLKNKYTKKVTEKDNKSVTWAEKTIQGILTNQWYNGKRIYAGMEGDAPRIVDEILFNKVQKAIESRKGVRLSKPKYNYLLKGLIRCERCGRNYYARFRPNGRDNHYQCSGTRNKKTNCGNSAINIPKLESFIIKHLFKSKDLLKMMESISQNNEVTNQLGKVIKKLNSDLSEKKQRLKNYAKLLGGKLKDEELIVNEYYNTKKQIDTINQKLIKSKIELSDLKNLEPLNNYNEQLDAVNKSFDFNTLNIAVNKIVEDIIISSYNYGESTYETSYIIKIIYKGLNDHSIWTTHQPYEKWYCNLDTDIPFNEESSIPYIFGLKEVILKDKDMFHFNQKE
ncbi:recombinase family protein [Aestuariivivens sediminis]|uniref:recombinase family protein n=1 Tax=Aestuariivivens sediminis TaxID=2913557 RepID=UPI001F58AE26|nr:recombinase family protein [Aestuariivivens sediminis]